jgi:hypothetical protein
MISHFLEWSVRSFVGGPPGDEFLQIGGSPETKNEITI